MTGSGSLVSIPAFTSLFLQEIVWRIVDADDPERIILFGSYAYGTPIRIAMEISCSSSPGLMRSGE